MATQLSYEELLNSLKKGNSWPVIFLQGEEPYFIDQITHYIEQHLIPEQDKGFNQTILYGKDTDIISVISAAKRYPMMAQKQLVIVKEANDLKDIEKVQKVKSGNKEMEIVPLLEYVKNPLQSTILVFAYKNKNLDGRKPLAKAIEEKGVLFTSKPLYDDKVPQWIVKLSMAKGYTIQESAARLMAENVGNNLSRLHNELEKILVNLAEKSTITEQHVHQFVGISKEYNIFELQSALSRKDALKCNKIIQYFHENKKENPIPLILGNLFSFFSKILLIKYHKSKDENEAAALINLPPFVAKEFVLASKNYSDHKIIQIFNYLRTADMQSKGYAVGSMNEFDILRELVFKILH